MYKYSQTTGGFYIPEIHGDNIPQDAVVITDEYHSSLMEGQASGKIISADSDGYPILIDPPAPSIDEIKASYSASVQQYLDDTVKTRGYDNIVSCCSYSNSAVQTYKDEALAAIQWRDSVWEQFYSVINGDPPLPPIEEIIQNLPTLNW